MLTKNPTNIAKLNDELREFAEDMPVIVVRPPREDLIAAVEPHFPELVEEATYLHEFLDPVGIAVIIQLGPDLRISWSVADSEDEAQLQLEKYSQPVYCKIRKALNIDYQWIIKVRPNFWGYDDDELIASSGSFNFLKEKPPCWIVNLSD
jgi:hypothetical protein